MFELARLKDTVTIAPSEFGKPLLTAVTDALSEKYPNKVVPGLGLCVTLHDILHVGEAHLYASNASMHLPVEFRLVMFRPYVGEVLTGTVVSSDPKGMRVSLGFFDEIHVPSRLLQSPSYWSPEEGVWVWNVTDDHQLFYDLENELRFRVEEVRFREETNVSARKPKASSAAKASSPKTSSGAGGPTNVGCSSGTRSSTATPTQSGSPAPAAVPPAMLIVAGTDRSGLGLSSWWPPDEDEAADDAGAEAEPER